MGYYYGAAGDYYQGGGRGDLFGSIKKFGGKLLGAVSSAAPIASLIPGPIGAIARGVTLAGTALGGMGGTPAATAQASGTALAATKAGALARVGKYALPAITAASIAVPAAQAIFGGSGGRKRRSMNAANVQALRRALRRVDSFRHLAKKSGAMPAVRRMPAQRGDRCNTHCK